MLEERIRQMRASRSWRLTAPLRGAIHALRRLRGAPVARPQLGWSELAMACSPRALPSRPAALLAGQSGQARRLLVDVTELALEDLGAGVQRVTRRLLAELMLAPPAGYRIEPVRLSADAGYVFARRFLCAFVGAPTGALGADVPIEPRPDDHFFGLDHCRDRAQQLRLALQSFVTSGVPISLILHDVLPLTHPQWFPPAITESYEAWLRVVADVPCRVLSVSQQSATELAGALRDRRLDPPSGGIVTIPLGSDLLPTVPTAALPPREKTIARVLMVGTIEPRKAHAQALDAFEALWAQGESFELIIAGRPGWHVEDLVQRLRRHPEQGRRLHWIEDADDRVLSGLYADCDLLLMASKAEGYGLPIAEAGRCGMALLLRDLPVFREVAGDRAQYFAGEMAGDITDALKAWRAGSQENITGVPPWTSWAQAAEAVALGIDWWPERTEALGAGQERL